MASGQTHRVVHPEQIAVFPELRVVVIGGKTVGFHILEVELIEEMGSTPSNGNSHPR